MEIDFKEVIERISKKVGQLQVDNDILTIQVEKLQEELDTKQATSDSQKSDISEAEVIREGDNGR